MYLDKSPLFLICVLQATSTMWLAFFTLSNVQIRKILDFKVVKYVRFFSL